MSANKKKGLPDLQQAFEAIKDLLITIKPQLDNSNAAARSSLVHDIHQVASLAESFTERRLKSNNKSWMQLADTLDQEGVNLWNASGLVRKYPDSDSRALVAALRLAGFRLVEAGMEFKPGIASLLHVLQLASKAGATLSELGSHDMAASVLTSAAKFEKLLKTADDPDGTHRQGIACATIVYLSSRMEAAWREGNYSVAEFMSQQITGSERLALLPPHERELLAAKVHDIGKSLLKGHSRQTGQDGSTRAADAVQWLQKSFTIVEHLEDSAKPGVAELKISILRTLARAYFLSGSHDRAEAALEELIPSIDASTDRASPEYQELRWLRVAVLKRRKAGDAALLDAFKSIIDRMKFTEADITHILQDLRTLSHRHSLVLAVNQHCLQRALASHEEAESIVRLLLSLVFHCSKDEDHARAINELDSAFKSVCEAEFELPSISTVACVTLIWQFGDRYYNIKKWSEAADWFVMGSHQLFQGNNSMNTSKCLRKAALCKIEQREYAQASALIRRCPTNEASTHYVIFLSAVHQGLTDEAIRAIEDMLKAPDFDRKMLLLATQISHESEMKTVLLSVLEALLKTLKVQNSGEPVVEAMALLRCIIRLILKLLVEHTDDRPLLVDAAISHFRSAVIFAEAARVEKAISLIIKDVSWLWRTAYNCAIQGCLEWEHCDERVSDLFDISRQLLETYCQASPVDVDAEVYLHLANASFAAVSGRVLTARELKDAGGTTVRERLTAISTEIKACKTRIISIMDKNKIIEAGDILRVQYFLHTLRVFEVEALAQLKEWDQLLQVIGDVASSGPLAVDTYEAIADILWAEKDCPVNVLYAGLESILRASLEHNSLSVEKFARWLRAICTIMLSRNTATDRAKAIGYVEQALSVIEQNSDGDEAYPLDERQWLLSTSYNTGVECLHTSSLDEAKRWFESSTVICKFVPGGKEAADKISETYTHLLARYSRE